MHVTNFDDDDNDDDQYDVAREVCVPICMSCFVSVHCIAGFCCTLVDAEEEEEEDDDDDDNDADEETTRAIPIY